MKECALNTRRVLPHPDGWSSAWSEWADISKSPNFEGCGIYQIRFADAEGFPVEIPRFVDTDKDGILQICYSENIKRGIYRFFAATEGKRYTHAEGERLQLLKKYTNLEQRYKDCKMEYSFRRQGNRKEARMEQERLIKCYVKKYGEVPPNNNNFPDKHIDWESLPDFDTGQPIIIPNSMNGISFNSYRVRITKTGENV